MAAKAMQLSAISAMTMIHWRLVTANALSQLLQVVVLV